jgi:FixJ family two-component response regulator
MSDSRIPALKFVELPLIAIIEDDDAVRESLQLLLASSGFSVEAYASAEAFLEMAELCLVQCIVTDLQLAGMSGLQLQQRLVTLGHCIPTIVVTARPTEHLSDQAITAGAVAFLSKPLSSQTLLVQIRLALISRLNSLK